MKLIHDAKQRQNKKTQTKYHPKMIQNALNTHLKGQIDPYEVCNLCT